MQSTVFDTGYHHHWKLMAVLSGLVFVAIITMFTQGWVLPAVALGLGFGILALLWLTIDPPNVTDEDVDGKPRS